MGVADQLRTDRQLRSGALRPSGGKQPRPRWLRSPARTTTAGSELGAGEAPRTPTPHDQLMKSLALTGDLGPGVGRIVVAGNLEIAEAFGCLGLGEHRHHHQWAVRQGSLQDRLHRRYRHVPVRGHRLNQAPHRRVTAGQVHSGGCVLCPALEVPEGRRRSGYCRRAERSGAGLGTCPPGRILSELLLTGLQDSRSNAGLPISCGAWIEGEGWGRHRTPSPPHLIWTEGLPLAWWSLMDECRREHATRGPGEHRSRVKEDAMRCRVEQYPKKSPRGRRSRTISTTPSRCVMRPHRPRGLRPDARLLQTGHRS